MSTQRQPRTPTYRHHRPSGLAVVTIHGRDVYLGKHGSPESRVAYDRLIAEWLLHGRQSTHAPRDNPSDLTITELCLRYHEWATGYYRKLGEPTSEIHNINRAILTLEELYGDTAARDFGPLALKAVRNRWVDDGITRLGCNRLTGIVKRMFRWATEHEFIPPTVYHGLAAVSGLRKGRTEAKDNEPVGPVPDDVLKKTLDKLSPMLRAMIGLQCLSGMRPGEVIQLRGADLDMSGPIWEYRPLTHKTQHHTGRNRVVFIGPRAQEVLRPWFRDDPHEFIFGPRQNREHQLKGQPKPRPKTVWEKRHRKRRVLRDHYTRNSYLTAIHRACKLEKVNTWGPNRLRHLAATNIRAKYGIEATRTVLGHSDPAVTLVYAERDLDTARRIMGEVG
jgi:integrase